jgi:menaquinone-dependent protoporphyrinogen IX oxidase
MKKDILIVYYTQSGQMKQILENLVINMHGDCNITWEEIMPTEKYPFPWTAKSFFNVMPESVQGIPCSLDYPASNADKKWDLVILGYPIWYLSPAIPITSFLKSDYGKKLLSKQNIVTVIGSRNMWAAAQEDIKKLIKDIDGNLVGNIVLRDKHQNLMSVGSIVHWMFTGQKTKKGIFPKPGVSDVDIKDSSKFGTIILEAIKSNDFTNLQNNMLKAKAIDYLPDIASMELKAKRIFNIWSNIILKKAKKGDKAREKWVKIFKYYLFAVIIVLSPIASLVVYVTYPLFFPLILKKKRYYTSCELKEK